jgi:hypothetical protein
MLSVDVALLIFWFSCSGREGLLNFFGSKLLRTVIGSFCWSQFSRCLRLRSEAVNLQELRFSIQSVTRTWTCVYFNCCMLPDTGLFEGSILRPEDFYREWRVCILSRYINNYTPNPEQGCCVIEKRKFSYCKEITSGTYVYRCSHTSSSRSYCNNYIMIIPFPSVWQDAL